MLVVYFTEQTSFQDEDDDDDDDACSTMPVVLALLASDGLLYDFVEM